MTPSGRTGRGLGAVALVAASLASCSPQAAEPELPTGLGAARESGSPARLCELDVPGDGAASATLASGLSHWPLADAPGPEEEAAAQASRLLDRLAALLAHPAELAPEACSAFCTQEARVTQLRPDGLARVGNDEGGWLVRRGDPGAEQGRGPAALARALRDLLTALPAGEGLTAETWVVSVAGADTAPVAEVAYRAHALAGGRHLEQRARWELAWLPASADAPERLTRLTCRAFEEVLGPPAGALFADVSTVALGPTRAWSTQLVPGLDSWAARLDRSLGPSLLGREGLAVGDADGDGLEDLYVCQPGGLPNLLFVQRPDGTASEQAGSCGLDFLDSSRSALLLDLDGDGDQDLALGLDARVVLLENDGGGRFERRLEFPFAAVGALSASDFDVDGDLDLFVCSSHVSDQRATTPLPFHGAVNGPRDRLLRNRTHAGAWDFVDATTETGLEAGNHRYSSAACWEDYDQDGDPDLYVADEHGPGSLYRNEGGHFVHVTASVGLELSSAGKGVSWGDVDRDGDFDLFVSGTFSAAGQRASADPTSLPRDGQAARDAHRGHARGGTLWLLRDEGTFEDVTERARVAQVGWARGALLRDLDGDGWCDLFAPNGFVSGTDPQDLEGPFWHHVAALSPTGRSSSQREAYELGWLAMHRWLRRGKSLAGRQRHAAFLNLGDGTFAHASAPSGLDLADDGRGAAVVDWDLDGAPDLVTLARTGPRLRILRNRNPGGARWLALRPVGARTNRDGVGARIEVRLDDGALLVDAVRAGEGHLAQSSRWLHFGLGAARIPRSVHVAWPGGEREEFTGVGSPGRFVLVEGTGRAQPWSGPGPAPLIEQAAAPQQISESAHVPLAAPVPLPPLAYLHPDGVLRSLVQPGSPPLQVLLWAPGCEASTQQLRALAADSQTVARTGVRLLALAPQDDEDDGLLADIGWPFEHGTAPPELLATLDALQRGLFERERPLPLPCGFLIDPDGQLAVVTFGAIGPEVLTADVERLAGTAEEARAAAVPFPGRWLLPPAPADLERLAETLAARGRPEAARFYELAGDQQRGTTRARVELESGNALAREGRVEEALDYFRSAARIDPRLAAAWQAQGAALFELRRVEQALEAYQRAVELDARHGATRFNRALAYAALGRLDAAREEAACLHLLDEALALELEAALPPAGDGR